MNTPEVESKPGWDGPDLPIEVQATILMRKFRAAVEVVARNAVSLHEQTERMFNGVEDGEQIAAVLNEHPMFIRCMNKLADSYGEFGDSSFRKTSTELFGEARDELEDMIVWMSFGLWVFDGAELPEGLLEFFNSESGDEEE